MRAQKNRTKTIQAQGILLFPVTLGIFLISFFTLFTLSCSSPAGKEIVLVTQKDGQGKKIERTINIQACEKAPKNMVCIPGGKSYVGANPLDKLARENEKPMSEVFIQTFYMDKYEITTEEYNKCVAAGACRHFYNIKHPLYKDYKRPKQPAVPLSWDKAFAFCRWKGKRLPTEAEWEKVARGGEKNTIYPWGNEAPSCDKASYEDCNLYGLKRRSENYKDIYPTKDVGSFPPGHYGVYDMAGNGYEWVNDWATDSRVECGGDCLGINPLGPCSGRYPCGKRNKKILKGGSWWWPAEQMRASWRRSEKIQSGGHRLSARCAADSPYLSNGPAWMINNPPSEPPLPDKPDADQLKILHSITTDTLDKPLCRRKWTSPAHCKDPVSYVKSNEFRTWLFADYIRNLGGGYIGVAADANYTFIALAKSRWVWLMDFDKNIVNLHRMIKAFVVDSPTPKEFAEHFNPRNYTRSVSYLEKFYPNYTEMDTMKYVLKRYSKELYPYYLAQMKPHKYVKDFGWLRYKKNYDYIRLLFQQNRISINPGDLLKNKTLRSIGKAAKELGTVIRVYYPSNAEEFWKYNNNYKANVLGLPFDMGSVALRTIHEYPWHPPRWRKRGYAGFWHYVVHGAQNYQRKIRLKDYYLAHHWKAERILPTQQRDFSTIHLPHRIPEDTPSSYLK